MYNVVFNFHWNKKLGGENISSPKWPVICFGPYLTLVPDTSVGAWRKAFNLFRGVSRSTFAILFQEQQRYSALPCPIRLWCTADGSINCVQLPHQFMGVSWVLLWPKNAWTNQRVCSHYLKRLVELCASGAGGFAIHPVQTGGLTTRISFIHSFIHSFIQLDRDKA